MNRITNDISESPSVPAVARAIRIVEAVSAAPGRYTVGDLARDLKIAPASCFRIVSALTQARWLARDRREGLRLSAGLLPVLQALHVYHTLAAAAQSHLERLAAQTSLTAKLVVREGSDQVTIARAESSRPYAVSGPVGARYAVVLGASGACLLSQGSSAELEQAIAEADASAWTTDRPEHLRKMVAAVGRQGWCENVGVHPQGIETLAMPTAMGESCLAVALIGLRDEIARHPRRSELPRQLRQAVEACEGDWSALQPPTAASPKSRKGSP